MADDLRLGRPARRDEFNLEDSLFKSNVEAYRQDVVPRSRGIDTVTNPFVESQPKDMPTTPAQTGGHLFDLSSVVFGSSAPAPRTKDTGLFNLAAEAGIEELAAPEVAPAKKEPSLLSKAGEKIDNTITSLFGDNKPAESQIDPQGLAEYKAEEAAQIARVANRRAELGTDDKDRGYARKLFDSAAAGMGSAVSGTVEFIGEQIGSDALKSLARAGKEEAMALTPRDQDTLQKVSGAVGSMLSYLTPGLGVVKGLQLANVGVKTARTMGAGVGAVLESAGVAQETYEKALSETGNKDLANQQAWKAAAANLPIGWVTNRLGIFGEGGAVKQIGMSFLTEGAQEGAQNITSNLLGFKPVGEGFSESVAIGGLAGGGFKGGMIALEKMFAEATPEQREQIVQKLIDDGQQARQEIFDAMMADERSRQILEASGIESADDPRFQKTAIQISRLEQQLAELDILTDEQVAERTKRREADVQAAFGATAEEDAPTEVATEAPPQTQPTQPTQPAQQTQPTQQTQTAQATAATSPVVENTEAAAPTPAPTVAPAPTQSLPAARTSILTPDGLEYDAQWEVVEADSIRAAMKEGVAQPRDRTRAASDVQIRSIAQEPDFKRLSDTSKTMDYGAPTLTAEGAIVGGNGRYEGVAQAYANNTAGKYRAELEANAERLGLDPNVVENMRQPVLVRRLTQPVDTRKLAIQSNQTAGLGLGDAEQAALDAERMIDLHNIRVEDDGSIPVTLENAEAIRAALKQYTVEEVGQLMTAEGGVSQTGLRRIRNAILFKAYGKSDILSRLTEATDNDLKNISIALVRASAILAKNNVAIQEGRIDPKYDIRKDLRDAVETMAVLRATGTSVEQFQKQTDIDGVSSATKILVQAMADYARSSKSIAAILDDYSAQVASTEGADADMFGGGTSITKEEALTNAIRKLEEERRAAKAGQPAADETGTGQRPAGEADATAGGTAGGEGDAGKGAGVRKGKAAAVKKPKVEDKLKEKAKAERESKKAAKPAAKAEPKAAPNDPKAAPKSAPKPEPDFKEPAKANSEAIEFWEDNDDGQNHVPFAELPKEFQQRWVEAYTDGYASAEEHDQIMVSLRRSQRAENANRFNNTDPDAAFRLTGKVKGMAVNDVGATVEQIVARWKNVPAINVMQSERDLPNALQTFINQSQAQGKVPGIFWRGEVYLIGDNLSDSADVGVTVMHEVAGHYGLRQILGDQYGSVMDSIYAGNRMVREAADEMMRVEGLPKHLAVEEVLADMAQTQATPTREFMAALRQLFAAIRKWARETLGIKLMTDNDVRQIVANARRYVVEGADAVVAEGDMEFAPALRQTGAPTFYSALERAFRSSKIEKMPADQWQSWLSKNAGNLGVKKEEIKWVGIGDWLSLEAQQGRTIERQEILNFIAGNMVRVNDLVLTSGKSSIDEADLYSMVQEIGEDPDFMTANEMMDAVANHYGWSRNALGNTEHSKYTEPGGDRSTYTELILVDPNAIPYKQNDKIHFGDKTEGKSIGWLRMIVRKDASGNDVLFLEEIQSQRGQDIRDDESVPDAPFMKDTQAWTSLLLKRAIAYAQGLGIDRIAWTRGDQQVERYKLSKQVDTIYSGNNGDGTWTISATKNGRSMISKDRIPAEKLAGFVGKDIADQIIASGDGIKISGEDMDIGGDGVRNYYNRIVPSVAKSIVGKDAVTIMQIEDTGEQLGFLIPENLQRQIEQDGLPLFRRKDYERQFADLPANIRQTALDKGSPTPPTITDRLRAMRPMFFKRLVQGVFDKYRSVREIDDKAYKMLRMSTSSDGGLYGMLHYGQVFNDDGALNVKKGTKGLIEILKPVGIETDRFMLWIAANRAEQLKKQDRENYFTDQDIANLKQLNAGKMEDGRSRSAVYAETLRNMNELNRSALDLAKQAGLIDEAGYRKFASDIWYVPFYRQMDDDGTLSAAQTSSGAVNQYLSKRLKGSSRGLNDLMENVMMNWSHILSASMKNLSANATLDAARQMGGIVTKLTKVDDKFGRDDAGNVVPLKYAVKTMVGGKEAYHVIEDELLFDSLNAVANMGGSNMLLDVARSFKTTLTRMVALSPTFKINNLIRDSIQAIGVSELKKNPIANVIQGWKAYNDERAEALVGGGLFAMGNAFDGDRAANVKRLIKQGVDKASILTTEEKAKAWLKKAWDRYDNLSDKSENANRLALYKQLIASGASHLEAAYAARDLQDFSLQGSWAAIRYASQVLPYFNARLQGLYKLGREGFDPVVSVLSGKADATQRQKAARFAAVTSAVTIAGLILYLSQKDDDDWKKREQWDRDSFFWFKIPGTDMIARIPKPFEIGAIASIIERFTEQIVDSSVEGKVFGQRLMAILHDNLAINPMPQMLRPIMDVASNKDSFTDRPIESMGMERLSPGNRVNPSTSDAAVIVGRLNGLLADGISAVTGVSAEKMQLSPIQYDYLLRGYLGWIGTVIQTSSEILTSPFREGERPTRKIDDFFVVGNFVKEVPQNQSGYVTSFYENAKTISQAAADFNMFLKAGQLEKATEVLNDKRDLIMLSKLYTKGADMMADVNRRARQIERDETLDGDAKRIEIDRLAQMRIEVARMVEEIRKKQAGIK